MALKNFIKEGSYSLLSNVTIDKTIKNLSFKLICYENDKKEIEIFNKEFSFQFNYPILIVENVVNTKEEVLELDKKYVVLEEGCVYQRFEQTVLDENMKVKEVIVSIYKSDYSEKVYYNKTDKYYIVKNNKYVEYEGWDNELRWKEIPYLDSNIYAATYNFCKKLKLFEGVEDC